MATRYSSAARRLALRQDGTKDWRAYVDFRQKQYPSVAGTPTFTTVPSDLEVFPLTEAGCASWKGRYPSAGKVVVEEPALIGTVANPRVKWAGRGAIGVWKATTNICTAPNDFSVWTNSNTTNAVVYDAVLQRNLTRVTLTAGGGYIYILPTFTAAAYSFQCLLKKGTDSITSVGFAAVLTAWRSKINITWATQSVAWVGGASGWVDWIDSNTVRVSGWGNAQVGDGLVVQGVDNGTYTDVGDVQCELGTYATPFTPTTRAAGSLAYAYILPTAGAIECWYYGSAGYATERMQAFNIGIATAYLELYYDPASHRWLAFLLKSAGNYASCYQTTADASDATVKTWKHLKVVYDQTAGTVVLYINGTAQTNQANVGTPAGASIPSPLYVGCHSAGGIYGNGLITDLAIWDTSDTSTAHYTGGTYWQPSDLMALNRSGSHDLTGGRSQYLFDMPTTFTFDITFKPRFAYDIADPQYLMVWIIDSTHQLIIAYLQSTDTISVYWHDGGTARTLNTVAFASTVELDVWQRLSGTINLTSASSTGSVLYWNGAAVDSEWSGTIDAKVTSFHILAFRTDMTSVYDFAINEVRLFPNYLATAAEVANNFKDVKAEEIVWHFNGHATGRTRCNVTDRVLSMSMEKRIESPLGNACANQMGLVLSSPQGQFADDQIAAFDAQNEVYNGTVDQRYMSNRCGMELESWVSNAPELEFVGRIDEAGFKRRSGVGTKSRVELTAYDAADDIRRKTKRQGGYYEDYDLCAPSSTGTSLLHKVTRLATAPEWYNFFPNSSFENAAIGSSCSIVAGTFTRTAGGLLGSYEGVYAASVASNLYWITTFQGYSKKLNVGENWNWSIYAKATAPCSATVTLSEYAGTVQTALATSAIVLSTSWQKVEVTKEITTSSTNTLRCDFYKAVSATATIDCSMLIQNDTSLDYFVINSDDGAAGTYAADSAESGSYDTVGFDGDEAKYVNTTSTTLTHPWARVESGDRIWDHVRQIGDALVAGYIGMDAAGTMKMRTIFKTGYVDPSPLFTVGTEISNLDSVIEPMQANKIVAHGVKIIKHIDDVIVGGYQLIWSIQSDPAFKATGGATVSSAGYWPSADPEYWAKYGSVDD